MSGRFSRRRVPLLLVLVLVGALTPAGPALGVTKSQVDRACSTSAGAYDAYLAAKSEFQAAAEAYEVATIEVENVLYRQERAAETLGNPPDRHGGRQGTLPAAGRRGVHERRQRQSRLCSSWRRLSTR